VGHVTCIGDMTNMYKILVGKPEEKRSHVRLDIDGRTVLKSILSTI
jgi:hypothetical protein